MRLSSRIKPSHALKRGAASRRTGKARVEKILQAGREILAHEGYPSLTLRRVAVKTGISLGNLQHYFPTKKALVHGIIEHMHRYYDSQFEKLFARVADTPLDRFRAVIRYLLDDLSNPLTHGFFFQAGALGLHDEYAAECMEMSYEYERTTLAKLIAPLVPGLSKKELSMRAAAIQALVEGSTLSLKVSGRKIKPKPGLNAYLETLAMRIATGTA
jgi:AcrR family transcriptional regulator